MNPRQRRGLLLIGIALVGAVAVFLAVSGYVSDVRTQVEPLAQALVLNEDVEPYQPIGDRVQTITVPERWLPEGVLQSAAELGDLVSTVPLPSGTMLQDGMLVQPPRLEEGQRELAILVDAETGVGGKIAPNTAVDIYATFDSEGQGGAPPEASIVVENAKIIDVGVQTTTTQPTQAGAFEEEEVVPVTFALSVDESLRLTYIESFSTSVRLALRNPVDEEEIDTEQRRYSPDRSAEGASEGPDGDDGGSEG